MSKDQYTKGDEIKDSIENSELDDKTIEDVDNQDKEIVEEEVKSEESTNEEKLQAEKNKYLRLFAEFENYKKRTTQGGHKGKSINKKNRKK